MKIKPSSSSPGKVMIEFNFKDEQALKRFQTPEQRPAPLFKLKKILVPTDFSECSIKALVYAIPFAKEFAATIDVLHVVPPYYAVDPYGVSNYEAIEKELNENGAQTLAKLVLEKIPETVPVETFVRNGRPSNEIVDAARELESDLIIIATHGHTGLKHAFIGSTAENVVRHAPCPVLTVREQEHEFVTD